MEFNHDYPGKFIIFEGGEGAGKTALIPLLKAELEQEDYEVIATKEPNCGTPRCLEICAVLDDAIKKLSAQEELDFMIECRQENFGKIVIPALKAGKVVLCDRSYPSTVAYQHYGRGLDLTDILKKDAIARQNVNADLILLLDIAPSLGLKRKKPESRFEKESFEFHRRVRNGYLEQLNDDKDNIWRRIDAKYPVEITKKQAVEIIYKIASPVLKKERK